jgi:hypothetical protein
MATITVDRENSTPIDLYYEDHGTGDRDEGLVIVELRPIGGKGFHLSGENILC